MFNIVQNYRSSTSEIEAIQFDGHNYDEVTSFMGNKNFYLLDQTNLFILTKVGDQKVNVGDFVMQQPFPTGNKDFFPINAVVFHTRYTLYDKKERRKEEIMTWFNLVFAWVTGICVGLALSLLFIP